MKIHEYQGKEILKKFGVTVPRGIPCFSVDEAVKAAETLGGKVWVVKAQIHAGGRGKGGGVKVAKSMDEVRALRRADPRHATGDAPDRARRPESAPPAGGRRRRHQEGILRRGPDRPRLAEGGDDGLLRRRHGHRGSGAQDARKDHQGLRRSGDRPDRRASQCNWPNGIGVPAGLAGAGHGYLEEALHLLHGNGRLTGRNQPVDSRRQR
jgi:hypothetical protein